MLEQHRRSALEQFSRLLGVSFVDINLLHQAFIHSSYVNERKNCLYQDNERLEFLGDAVLDVVISEQVFRRFPDMPEGELTKARANLVCEQSLACKATQLQLGQYLLLGKGEQGSGGRERASILADAFEALLGAIYLDAGFLVVADLISKQFANEFSQIAAGQYNHDFKTLLQEVVQRNGEGTIRYEVLSAQGPDHNKSFEVVVLVSNQQLGFGVGKSKKEAEQIAAKQALNKLTDR